MELAIMNRFLKGKAAEKGIGLKDMSQKINLTRGKVAHPYRIKKIEAKEEGVREFLFTLGCYEGEEVKIISVLADNYVIHVKDSRYSIDSDLAKRIVIEEVSEQ